MTPENLTRSQIRTRMAKAKAAFHITLEIIRSIELAFGDAATKQRCILCVQNLRDRQKAEIERLKQRQKAVGRYDKRRKVQDDDDREAIAPGDERYYRPR